jgi:hypothetical protein
MNNHAMFYVLRADLLNQMKTSRKHTYDENKWPPFEREYFRRSTLKNRTKRLKKD